MIRCSFQRRVGFGLFLLSFHAWYHRFFFSFLLFVVRGEGVFFIYTWVFPLGPVAFRRHHGLFFFKLCPLQPLHVTAATTLGALHYGDLL